MPLIHNIIYVIDSYNKSFYEFFLAPQFRASVNCLVDSYQHFLIFTVGIMVLLYEHKYIINIDLYLPNQLNFEDHIICDVRTLLTFTLPFIPQILIASEIILQITLGNQFIALKLIKRNQEIPHTENCAKQRNKVFLVLLSDNLRF